MVSFFTCRPTSLCEERVQGALAKKTGGLWSKPSNRYISGVQQNYAIDRNIYNVVINVHTLFNWLAGILADNFWTGFLCIQQIIGKIYC